MDAFNVDFRQQVEMVLEGNTADGTGTNALWPLPDMRRYDKLREKIIEVSLWTLYRLGDDLRRREDVRTFVIWITAAHMWRLTRKGILLETAAREAGWMSLIVAEKPSFLTTSPFARKLMPAQLPGQQPLNRTEVRKDVLDILRICRSRWRPRDHEPFTVAFDTRFAMKSYSIPAHFLTNPFLAFRWTGHIATVAGGACADHVYWIQIATQERKVYAFFIGNACKATLESHRGQLDHLIVHETADDVVYDRLAFALAHATHVTGDAFRLPKETVNPAILSLLATNARHVRDVQEARAKAKKSPARAEPEAPASKKCWRENTDIFLVYVVLAIAMSYLLPLSIIAAPTFAQHYVHLWRAALSLEPNCISPARTDCKPSSPFHH